MKNEKHNMITISEAAEIAGVTMQAVRQWIKTGKIRGEKKQTVGIKKVWFVSETELKKLLSE